MKICICDDDITVHNEIKEFMLPYFNENDYPSVAVLKSGEELVAHYSTSDPFDIIFLDIKMGRMNGIDTAAEIRKIDPDAIIVFISGYKEYVFDAFRCEALHFMTKPLRKLEFDDVFERALHKYTNQNNKYPVCWRNHRDVLRISDITYIEGYRRRLKVHTLTQTYEHIGKISSVQTQLQPHGFLRIHQGFVVNMHYIDSFGSKSVTLTDGTCICISGRRRPEALQMYDKFIQNWKW